MGLKRVIRRVLIVKEALSLLRVDGLNVLIRSNLGGSQADHIL